MWKTLLKAAKFAKVAHFGQVRAQMTPYYKHPMAVARRLWDLGHRDVSVLTAAYLHDVIEDTEHTAKDLYIEFGVKVATLVMDVTKVPGEPSERFYARIKGAGDSAMAIKMADRACNNAELHLAPASFTTLREKAAKKTALLEKIFSGHD